MCTELSLIVGQTVLAHYYNGIMVNVKYPEVA